MKKGRGILFILLLTFLTFMHGAKAADLSPLIKGGQGGWLNTVEPLTAEDFKNKAVLLDFWTYGCINCMQIIPDLEFLEEKYGNKLLIIGVHSAKFENEKGSDRILFAAKRFGLKHPVINDSDFAIWNSYGVKAWPTQILLDTKGEEIARWSGEGHRKEIDKAIDKLKLEPVSRVAPVAAHDASTTLYFPARTKIFNNEFFVADSGKNRILIADKMGKIIQIFGSGVRGFKDGDAAEAQFNAPRGFVVSGDKIYVADTGNHRIRVIDRSSMKVSTLLGNGKRGGKGEIASPWDVALNNNLLAIANAGTHQLLGYNLDIRKLGVLAGSGREDVIDGAANEAALAQPSGISVEGDKIYFVDAESSALRVLENGKVSTLIGTGLFDFGFKDGKYPDALLQHPQGLDVDGDKIWIADTYNNAVRYYDMSSRQLVTVKTLSGLNEPGDVFISGGKGYVTDTNQNTIREFALPVSGGESPKFTEFKLILP